MQHLVLRIAIRLAQILAMLVAVSILVFVIQAQIPGNAAEARVGIRPDLTPVQRNALVHQVQVELGLNKPLIVQYWFWLRRAVQFDFGTTATGESVTSSVRDRLWPSLELAAAASVLCVPIAILLALVSAYRENALWTGPLRAFIMTGAVVPAFWIGILLVLLCSVWLHILPASGYTPPSQSLIDHLQHLVLPAVTLAISQAAVYFRYVEQGLRTAMHSQYVRSARAKGLDEWRILYRHALPNAMIPVLTIFGVAFGVLIGGVVVVENVFAWPGVGSLMLYSLAQFDYNTVVAIVLFIASTYVVISMSVDMLYLILDPRTRRA